MHAMCLQRSEPNELVLVQLTNASIILLCGFRLIFLNLIYRRWIGRSRRRYSIAGYSLVVFNLEN